MLAIVCKLREVSGKLRERCDALSELIPQLPRSRDAAADLDAIVSNAQIKGDGGVKAWPEESLREEFQKAAEKLRNAAKNAKQFLQFDPKLAEADAQAGLQLLGIAQKFSSGINVASKSLAGSISTIF